MTRQVAGSAREWTEGWKAAAAGAIEARIRAIESFPTAPVKIAMTWL